METKGTVIRWTREDFLALLSRGREIKARRQQEANAKWEEQQRQKKIAAEPVRADLQSGRCW